MTTLLYDWQLTGRIKSDGHGKKKKNTLYINSEYIARIVLLFVIIIVTIIITKPYNLVAFEINVTLYCAMLE